MERGSAAEIRAMSGRVKRTDRAHGGKCVLRGQKERVGGGRDGGANGGVMDVQLKMDP